jgi:hypothetical protein
VYAKESVEGRLCCMWTAISTIIVTIITTTILTGQGLPPT